jgi:SAM-dependent methyltransferase
MSSPYASVLPEWAPAATRSARKIVPLALELTGARSVVDVGCGIGAWLSVFAEHGVTDYQGFDGSGGELLIDPSRFTQTRLDDGVRAGRTFDLAVCLEVAEHLPERSASTLVSDLCALAPTVLFSAAVPGQGGVEHVNEQWPDYWASLFTSNGYTLYDAIRPAVWDDEEIDWWYRQNVLVFSRNPLQVENAHNPLRHVVHPKMYAENMRLATEPAKAKELLRQLPSAVTRSFRHRIK